ncbi:hypothetical protein EBQ93_00490, partial [bacterium]|nr:hypothetical protein [bacterium]
FSVSAQDNIDPSEIADESTRLFAGGELDDFNKAFSGPNNTTNFPSETLFSLSDIGRKTYHMYRSTNYRLTRLANYQPLPAATATNEALSSPMLKITGSSITVDLNGFHLSRQTTDVDGVTTVNAVGIEIGYSPYDAAQGKFGLTAGATFATVSQPENITIRNGRIDNFGIGIVIHAGVKNVTLENLTISNAALGVVCAGQADKPAVSIFLKNVRIESDGTDKSAVLAWAKLKLESNAVNVGNMNYGDGTLMPEQVSPVGAEGTTLNVYSGILLVNTNNVSVYDVGCTNLGYARTVDENSTAEVIPSATFAINAIGCTSLQLEKIDASNNASERLVSGINISGCSAVTMTDVVATNNHIVVPRENDVDADIPLTPTITFGLWARGVSILSSQAVTINGLEVSRTLGASSVNGALAGTKSTAMGLYLDTIKVLNAQNIQSDYNDSQLASAGLTFGIYTEDLDSGVYEHISASSNTGAASTSAVLNNGSVVGMYFAGVCKDVQLKDISCNTNNSSSRYSAVRGISFASVNAASVPSIFETITLENVSACNNTQTHANGDEFVAGIYFGAAVTNLTMKNVHADKNSKSTAGNAYGMHFYNAITTGVFENVTADNNTAVGNAYGIQIMQPSANLVFDNCSFSVNSGAPGQGLRFNSTATNVTVQNSRMDGNSGTFGGGFNCGDAINVVIDNCSISNTSGSSPKAIQLNSALNVKLHRVKADRTNGTGATYGLYIVTTAQALEVKDCSFDGITTSGGASYGMYFTGEADNVQLRGVDMLRVVGTTGGTKGIYFQNAGNNVTIQDTNIVGVTGTTTNPVGAIFFDSTATNVKLNNVHVDSTQSSTATCYGLVIDDAANNIEIKNSSFDNTNATGAGIVYGINIASSAGVKALTMENVTADYTNGTSATTVYGMYIHAASGVNAKNISANNTSGVFARGIAFMGSCKNAYIDGLQASGTTSSGSTATSNNLRIEAGDGVTLKNAQCNGLVNSSGEFAAYSIDFVTSAQNIVLENVESNNGLNSTHDMYGIYINTGNTVSLKNVSASGNVSTDDSAYGIYFATSASNIYMDTVSANNNDGNINAEGVYFATLDIGSLQNVTANNNGNSSVSAAAIGIHCAGDANNVTLENVVASGNYGSHPALGAGGILFADTDTNSGLTFKNVVASNNTVTGTNPGTYAFGIKLNSAKSLVASDINCSYNVGPNATQTTNVATAGSWNTVSSVGMWLDTPVAVQLGNVTCDYNGVGSNTAQAYVFGLLLDNPSSVIIDSISCSNNAGNALGAGLFANGGSSVSVTNGLFNNNTSVAARVTTSAVISSGVNLSKHTVTPVLTVTDDYDDTFNNPELLKGSYGIVMDSTDNVTLDTVTASQNSGFRAFGVQLRSCNGVQMKDCITNQQSATGALFYDSARTAILDEGTNGSAVPVPDYGASAPDIFGSDILKLKLLIYNM